MRRLWSKMAATALATLMAWGCAGGMDDVNRVQPNYYDKSLFEGTWYFRQTLTEVPYEAFFVFEGLGTDIAKVRWEIQEKFLIAYSVSEPNPGANVPANGAPSYQPVAAWSITSHFDIIRDYNAATGEMSNVISENTSDRPWYERKYIRVDWSSSRTMSDYTFDNYITKVHLSGANHWIQPHEETDPDAAEISSDYISIVNAFDSWIPVEACRYYFGDATMINWFSGRLGATEDCGPATVRVRSSFMKLDPSEKNAYEPRNYLDSMPLPAVVDLNGDGVVDEKDAPTRVLNICADVSDGYCVGAPVACTKEVLDSLARDPFFAQFGYTEDDCTSANADHFRKFGYFRTEKIHYDRERGKTEAGRQYLINRFNIWERSLDDNGKPIPYAERTVRPIVYHMNAGMPEDLFEANLEIGRQWNEVFRETVAVMQGKKLEEVPDVYVVEPNSCSRRKLEEYAAKRPEAKEIAKRVIGGMDKLAPENMQQFCAALQKNLGFQWQKNGDLRYNFIYWVENPTLVGLLGFGPSYKDPDTGEIISGTAYVYGGAVDRSAAAATDIIELMSGRLSKHDILYGEHLRRSVLENAKRRREKQNATEVPETFFAEMDRRMSRYREMPLEKALRTVPKNHTQGKFDKLKALGVDKEFLLDDGARALLRSTLGWTGESEEDLSFFDLISPKAIERRQHIQNQKAEHGCMLDASFVDDSIVGLALEFDAKGLSRDQIFKIVREKIYVGVMLHEVGHTIGLRHNFEGSMDGLNYFDEFWEYSALPSHPGAARQATQSEEVAERLERCIERSNELGLPVPTTLDCLRASELKQSSIMDYGAKFNSDFAGLGKYDRAAVAFGYGHLIELFENEDVILSMERAPSFHTFFTDYKKLPEKFGGDPKNFLARRLVSHDEYLKNKSFDIINRSENLPRVSAAGCSRDCDRFPAVEVPYKFCIDDFNGSLACNTWDEGGNFTEVMESKIQSYEDYYFLNAFRRGRTGWDPGRHLGGLFSDLLRGTRAFQYYYYYNSLWRSLDLELDILDDLQVASAKSLNHIARILQTPEPGTYCRHADGLYRIIERVADCTDTRAEWVEVPLGTGRPQWIEWNDDYPHYQVESFGTYYERLYAINALVWTQSFFIQEEGDPRTYKIGFYKAFQEEIVKLLGAVATGELSAYGGAVEGTGRNAVYNPRPMIDFETFGTGMTAPDSRPTIAPAFSFQGREVAMILGMVLLTSTEDSMPDFRDHFNLVAKGSKEDFEIPTWVDTTDPDQYLEFTNPYSGVTYRSFANPRAPDLSFGLRTIRSAKEYYEGVWVPKWDEVQEARRAWEAADPADKEALRQAYFARVDEMDDVEYEMNARVELIDRIRYWYSVTALGF